MKNFIFDLDGTIITDGKLLNNSLAAALNTLRRHAQVIFASARPVRDMRPLLPASLQDCLMIGCNGGMAWQQDNCLFSNAFHAEDAAAVIAFLQQQQIPYVLDGRWAWSASAVAHPFQDYMRTLSDQEITEAELTGDCVSKILILDGHARDKMDRFLQESGYNFTLYHHRHDNLFDITPQKENKRLALEKLNVCLAESCVFGNDQNDFAMLDAAATAVFVGGRDFYPTADCYCTTAEIPALLAELTRAAAGGTTGDASRITA